MLPEKIRLDDFCCMRRGKLLGPLLPEKASLLNPVEIRTAKRKKALLLLHGFSSSPAVFRPLLPQLAGYYDGIFCPVLPGHASALSVFSQTKASDWLDYVRTQGNKLSQEFEQLDVLGFSLGGLLATYLSTEISLNHLYLLAPAFYLHKPVKPLLGLLNTLCFLGFKTIRSLGGDLKSDDNYDILYRQLPLATIREVLKLIQQLRQVNIACPTDVFLGAHDHVVHSKKIAKHFQEQSHISVHWLKESAHLLPLEADNATILSVIRSAFSKY